MTIYYALLVMLLPTIAMARTITVENNCPYTIWPALFTNPNRPDPNVETGWAAQPHTSKSLTIPNGWAGRVWGRSGCSGDGAGLKCITGTCNGGLQCDKSSGTGVPPATLAEWTFNGDGNQDFYDISNVDGFNLPLKISNNKGCHSPSCSTDLNAGCPDEALKVKDGAGQVLGCKTSCAAQIPVIEENCCSGAHNTPATCPKENVKFYSYFHDGCPDAYAYAYDEATGHSLWTCGSDLNADYTVTFCP